MPSPFPGMDPYLEQPKYWGGTHGSLVYTIRAALVATLPPGYYAEMDQYVWLAADDGDRDRLGKPDVFVAGKSADEGAPVALAEPTARTTLPAPRKRKGNRFVRITDEATDRVVTVIELLSPSNKEPGEDRANYLAKRNEYLATATNLVEIDLLRNGDRLPLGKPAPTPADYFVLVSRASDFPHADVWGFNVTDRLPHVPVPLRSPDPAVPLDLRACLDRAYDDAGYGTRIDYTAPPVPPLRPADAAWAAERLVARTGGA